MADQIKITKTGFVERKWNGESQSYDEVLSTFNLPNLRVACEIENGVTLGDIFRAVDADEPLKLFMSHYSWCRDIQAFHDQAKLSPDADVIDEDPLVRLQVSADVEIWEERLEGVVTHFGGVGAGGQRYSVSHLPMNRLEHLPVTIVRSTPITLNYREVAALQCKRDGFRSRHCKRVNPPYEYWFSLLEVLDAIYYDISFYGGPEDNEKFIKEISAAVEEIESGKMETVPLDEVRKRAT